MNIDRVCPLLAGDFSRGVAKLFGVGGTGNLSEAAVRDGARRVFATYRDVGEKGWKREGMSLADTRVGVFASSFSDCPDGMELSGPEYADRGEI